MTEFERRAAEAVRALMEAPPPALDLTAFEVWVLLGQVQLALRHPANRGAAAEIARHVAHRLQAAVAPSGALAGLARMGWMEECDVGPEVGHG